jgi:hypothetical protein
MLMSVELSTYYSVNDDVLLFDIQNLALVQGFATGSYGVEWEVFSMGMK